MPTRLLQAFVLDSLRGVFLPLLVGLVIERIWLGAKQHWRETIKAGVFLVLGLAAGALLAKPLGFFITQLLHAEPAVLLDLRRMPDGWRIVLWVVGPWLALAVGDFGYYWFHRAQHSFGPLWRLHAVHHSIETLNAVSNYHHWTEEILRALSIAPIMSFLVLVKAPYVGLWPVFFWTWAGLIHANSSISYGPLRFFLAEPRYHRIHHSIDPRHWHRNFAANVPLWDLLFGTACLEREFPARTGLTDRKPPESLWQYASARLSAK